MPHTPHSLILILSLAATARGGEAPAPGQVEFFERRVRPVLAEHCLGCHGANDPKGGLRLDSRAAVLRGAASGPVVTAGSPVRRDGAVKMPPKTALGPGAVADLETWVRMGLPWPEGATAAAAPPGDAPAASADARRRHWAFRPVRDVKPPVVKDRGWPRTTVDPFVLAGLEARGLAPSPEADRRTLIRRATFDLIGLPPTPEEVEAFADDRAPGAYEGLVDRLLASPHHGERWGRYWLDVARYADTKGYVLFEDAAFPWAYTYRDYVVGALNADLPYDRFLTEQIAADRLPGAGGRTLAALGFLSLGGRFMNNRHDVIDDRIDVVTRGLMGLTVTCARRTTITRSTGSSPRPPSRPSRRPSTTRPTRRSTGPSPRSCGRGRRVGPGSWTGSGRSWRRRPRRARRSTCSRRGRTATGPGRRTSCCWPTGPT